MSGHIRHWNAIPYCWDAKQPVNKRTILSGCTCPSQSNPCQAFESCRRGIEAMQFSQWYFLHFESYQWLNIGTLVTNLPGVWRDRVRAGTGWPGFRLLWLDEIARLICNFYFSMTSRILVWAYPSSRYTICCWDVKQSTHQPTNKHAHKHISDSTFAATLSVTQYHLVYVPQGLSNIVTGVSDGVLTCSFTRVIAADSSGQRFPLDLPYILFFAMGPGTAGLSVCPSVCLSVCLPLPLSLSFQLSHLCFFSLFLIASQPQWSRGEGALAEHRDLDFKTLLSHTGDWIVCTLVTSVPDKLR